MPPTPNFNSILYSFAISYSNILEVSENIHPKEYKINTEGKLEIKWSEGNHNSFYNPDWLRKNCYTLKKKYISPYKLWDNKLNSNLESITIDYNDIMKNDEVLIQWLDLLHEKGFSIVKNSPTEKKSALPLLNRVSHIRETFFKTPFEVINISKPNNLAYTAKRLVNHMDLPYYELPPGYQFLHCLINNAEGGMSRAVDGFFVANYLKHNDPETFKTLTRIPVVFVNRDYTQDKKRLYHAPEITLNKDGDFNDIRFSVPTMGIMDCSPEDMDKFYKAHHKFGRLLHDKRFMVEFKLKEGDYFECTKKEAKKAILHRFVAASAIGRYQALNEKTTGGMLSMDIAFPRNEKDWFEKLPDEIDCLLDKKFYYGHLFCHVMHLNYIVKKDVDPISLKKKLLRSYEARGAEYPAEHNVGHEYFAKPSLSNFYKKLDPTNGFNPGIGRTSKRKYWK